ncbi:MAG TPA: cytochrome P450 [Baekduia sp.]|nr:cytochrome P450 [Baekduia sp.]
MALPPGPRAPAAWQTAAWVLRPVALLEACAARHGDPFTLRLLWDDAPLVLTADPEAMAAVFAEASAAGGALRGGTDGGLLARFAGPSSILLLHGEAHLRQRRLLLGLVTGDALAGLRAEVRAIAREHVAAWPRGRSLATHPRLQALTLDVILRVVFGSRDRELHAAVAAALRLTHHAPALLGMSLLPRDLGPRSPYGAFVRAVARVDALLARHVATAAPDRDSALGRLQEAGLAPQELRDVLVTLLAAGHETTATALAWALERLARHPDVVAWVREDPEARLAMAADETLRVRPVLGVAPRTVVRPYELRGHRLDPGVQVAPCLLLALRDRARWGRDAHAFRPQRWAAGVPDAAFVPWGGGTRRCAGAGFARLEMVEVLRAVLEHHDLAADRPAPERAVRRSVTIGPGRGGRVVLAPRA